MTEPTITKVELFRAILALDVYHRGYNAGLDIQGTHVGEAQVQQTSSDEDGDLIGLSGLNADENIGFYALEYTLNGQP